MCALPSSAWAEPVVSPQRIIAQDSLPYRPVSGRVYVVGEVADPGSYVLVGGARLEDALQQAGGITSQGSWRRIEIRTNGRKRFSDLLRFRRFGEEQYNPDIYSGDVIFVPLRKKTVSLFGAVNNPGIYEIVREKNISELLDLAGGTTPGLSKESPFRIIRLEQENRQTLTVDPAPLALQQTAIQDGDLIYVPEKGKKGLPTDLSDLPLPEMEGISPFQENFVYVIGGAANPGPYPYRPYARLSHYVADAGGFTPKAKTRRMQLIRYDGSKKRVGYDDPIRPLPGDTINIPEKGMNGGDWTKVIFGIVGIGLSTTATILTLTR